MKAIKALTTHEVFADEACLQMGDCLHVRTSAKTGAGLDELLMSVKFELKCGLNLFYDYLADPLELTVERAAFMVAKREHDADVKEASEEPQVVESWSSGKEKINSYSTSTSASSSSASSNEKMAQKVTADMEKDANAYKPDANSETNKGKSKPMTFFQPEDGGDVKKMADRMAQEMLQKHALKEAAAVAEEAMREVKEAK